MKLATSLDNLAIPGLIINPGAKDDAPTGQLQLERLNGEEWPSFGQVLSTSSGS